MKCSIVVPVWNPGPNLIRCVDSLLAQTMAAEDYEIVMVDDGSTDGTADRIDALAKANPGHVRVVHTPASGWPGRPRNIGTDISRGAYVHYVDNDDILPPYALESMYHAAEETNADVIMGRPASDFRGVNQAIYRRQLRGVTLREVPDLVETTTPHKMFRRGFLNQHGIRFPEALPHEDQIFMMRAYIQAASITVLNDRCYYFYLRRLGSGRNAGDRSIDPDAHFDAVEQVMDVLDARLTDPELRDRIARRFYRVELLNLLWSRGTLDTRPEVQQHLFEEIRRISTTRFTRRARGGVGAVHRTMGALVENGELAATLAYARDCRRIGLRASARDIRWRAGILNVSIDATLTLGGQPLRCAPVQDGWALPSELAPTAAPQDRLLDPDRDSPDAELMLVSRIDSVTFGLGPGLRLDIKDSGTVRVTGTIAIDPGTALAGAPIDDGVWDLRLRLWFAGISRSPAVRVEIPDGERMIPMITADRRFIRPFTLGTERQLALDVGQWIGSIPATLAASSDLAPIASHWLRLSLQTDCRAGLPMHLLLTDLDGRRGESYCSPAILAGWPPDVAQAILRLPSDLPAGDWQPWLQIAGPVASAPAALPWQVHYSEDRASVSPRPAAPKG